MPGGVWEDVNGDMANVQEYKCPCCGGAIQFDSASQKMKCPFCGAQLDLETLKTLEQEEKHTAEESLNWENHSTKEWGQEETDGLNFYQCRSCGGEVVTDANTIAAACPFCGSPVVLMDRVCGRLKPDYIIPFQLNKNQAMEGLERHLKGKRLLPRAFKDHNHIKEVQGVYVPFWLFDADAKASMRYRGTRVRTWSDRDYNYTETRHYAIRRGGTLGFAHVPADGSSKMDDDLMESIEPFDFSQAVGFQTMYLAGYLADRYDVSRKDSEERANRRIRKSTEDAFARTVHGYATVVPESGDIRLMNGTSSYVLYPVWLLNTSWHGQLYTFAMNGQTGKFVGNLPMDKGAFLRWLFGLTGAIGAAVFVLSYLMWLL